MLALDTVVPARWRCQRMVSGPASCPEATSRSRSRSTAATTSGAMARGEDLGRLDRGSNAACPSARYRARSSYTQDRATP